MNVSRKFRRGATQTKAEVAYFDAVARRKGLLPPRHSESPLNLLGSEYLRMIREFDAEEESE